MSKYKTVKSREGQPGRLSTAGNARSNTKIVRSGKFRKHKEEECPIFQIIAVDGAAAAGASEREDAESQIAELGQETLLPDGDLSGFAPETLPTLSSASTYEPETRQITAALRRIVEFPASQVNAADGEQIQEPHQEQEGFLAQVSQRFEGKEVAQEPNSGIGRGRGSCARGGDRGRCCSRARGLRGDLARCTCLAHSGARHCNGPQRQMHLL